MKSQKISGVTGKKGELSFITALIERGFTPFIPIIDQGIDIVAEKLLDDNSPEYYAYEIKTSSFRKNDSWNWYVSDYNFRCADNVFYVLVFENSNLFPPNITRDPHCDACIIPSKELKNGHWSPCSGGEKSFDVTITLNMLRQLPKYSKTKYNSGIALRYLNKW
jgi:hypothetical protein